VTKHSDRNQDPPAPDASLSRALDDLEQMLGQSGANSAPKVPASGADADRDDRQAELPLLDEVVARGVPPAVLASAVRPSPDLSPEEAALCRRVAARLASEIDVIVQARLERTLETARHEIRKEVRKHIAITLPELIQDAAEQLDGDPD